MSLASYLLLFRHGLRSHKLLLLVLLLGLLVPWLVFVNVAEDIWEHGGFVGDRWIRRFIYRHSTPLLNKLALSFTAAGDPVPMIILAIPITLGLAVWGTRLKAWFFGLSVGGATSLNVLVKVLFGRPRPMLWVDIQPPFDSSFPSGHAMGAAALVTALGFLLWQHWGYRLAWALGLLFALGVGWSRVYLGMHYPSDVLAGWMGSVGWVAALHILFSPAFHQLRRLWREALHRHWPKVVAPPDETQSAFPSA